MALTIPATVHSATRSLVPVEATVAGATTTALVDGLRVELTPVDPQQGSLTANFYGSALAEAVSTFRPNAKVTITFETYD